MPVLLATFLPLQLGPAPFVDALGGMQDEASEPFDAFDTPDRFFPSDPTVPDGAPIIAPLMDEDVQADGAHGGREERDGPREHRRGSSVADPDGRAWRAATGLDDADAFDEADMVDPEAVGPPIRWGTTCAARDASAHAVRLRRARLSAFLPRVSLQVGLDAGRSARARTILVGDRQDDDIADAVLVASTAAPTLVSPTTTLAHTAWLTLTWDLDRGATAETAVRRAMPSWRIQTDVGTRPRLRPARSSRREAPGASSLLEAVLAQVGTDEADVRAALQACAGCAICEREGLPR